jgi:hypothetical protein
MRRILNDVKEHLPGHHKTGENTASTTSHGHHTSTTHSTAPHVNTVHKTVHEVPVNQTVTHKAVAPTTVLHEKTVPTVTKETTIIEERLERAVPIASQPVSVAREVREKPTIVKETIIPEERIEIQPVVHRERDQLEVHEVIQPMKERDIAATTVRHETLPSETRATIVENDLGFKNQYRETSTRFVPTVQTEAVKRDVVSHAPIIEEHLNKRIVEEIQPVLYKETVVPTIIQETQPIYEKVVEKPVLFEETRSMVELGTRSIGSSEYSHIVGQQPLPTGGFHPISKETIITKETFEDSRLPSAPQTNSKHLI